MSIKNDLMDRSDSKCELCGSTNNPETYVVSPKSGNNADEVILTCDICMTQLGQSEDVDVNHWRCLNDSVWSPVPAVQVVSWRMLNQLKSEGWASDLMDMLYLDEDTLAWAKDGIVEENEFTIKHIDSNGVRLAAGDTVVLIKDLNVKGLLSQPKEEQLLEILLSCMTMQNKSKAKSMDKKL